MPATTVVCDPLSVRILIRCGQDIGTKLADGAFTPFHGDMQGLLPGTPSLPDEIPTDTPRTAFFLANLFL